MTRLDPNFRKNSPYLKFATSEKAIRQNPDDALAYYYRGQAKAELGQHDAARTDYDTAVRLSPTIYYDGLLREIFG
ncbi:MAG: tetratricopeptide repeat protein [Candidatus Poribacteria bacterium]|nr:tetratricopeptide repeat protein [Candidatus Poribacteria bacterium]